MGTNLSSIRKLRTFSFALLAPLILAAPIHSFADETCMSPYMAKITGQEDYVYVWTLDSGH